MTRTLKMKKHNNNKKIKKKKKIQVKSQLINNKIKLLIIIISKKFLCLTNPNKVAKVKIKKNLKIKEIAVLVLKNFN